MKTIITVVLGMFLFGFLNCENSKKEPSVIDNDSIPYNEKEKKPPVFYNDSSYEGISRSIYTYEPYYGKVNITIQSNRLTKVDFMIRDSSLHEDFNGDYEKHYTGNSLYIEQCRNDWKGVQSYPDSLLKYQALDSVDAISGATWSYNIFKASANEALKKAKRN